MVTSVRSNAKTPERTLLVAVIVVLVIALASTSVLAGLFYNDYERTLASEPHYTYPKYYIQAINTSFFRGPLVNNSSTAGTASIVGLKVNLSWPAYVSGGMSYDGPVYFFILWSTHSYPSRFSSAISDDRNWSIYFLGPADNLSISISLPPGSYLFCVAAFSPSPVTGNANINVNYSDFAP